MALRSTDRNQHDPRDAHRRDGTTVARREVVDILAGAVLDLFVALAPSPSPDEAHTPEKPSKPVSFRQIRGSL